MKRGCHARPLGSKRAETRQLAGPSAEGALSSELSTVSEARDSHSHDGGSRMNLRMSCSHMRPEKEDKK